MQNIDFQRSKIDSQLKLDSQWLKVDLRRPKHRLPGAKNRRLPGTRKRPLATQIDWMMLKLESQRHKIDDFNWPKIESWRPKFD